MTFADQGSGDRLLRQARARPITRPGAAGSAQDSRPTPTIFVELRALTEAICSRRARGKAAFRRYQAGHRHQARSNQAGARRARAGRARHDRRRSSSPGQHPALDPRRFRAGRLSAPNGSTARARRTRIATSARSRRRCFRCFGRAARPARRPGRHVERARRRRSPASPPAFRSRMSRPACGPTTRCCPGRRRNIAPPSTPRRDLLFAPTGRSRPQTFAPSRCRARSTSPATPASTLARDRSDAATAASVATADRRVSWSPATAAKAGAKACVRLPRRLRAACATLAARHRLRASPQSRTSRPPCAASLDGVAGIR